MTDDLRDQLIRLQEAQLYTDHTVEELSRQTAALHRTIDQLTARLSRVESLMANGAPEESDESGDAETAADNGA